MASRLYIAKVGGGDIELTAFTGRKGVPFFDGDTPLIQLGMRCAMGEASQGTFKVTDPIAELPRSDFEFNLPAHKLVTWTEDSPGSEIWLSRGRVATYEGGRGTVAIDNQVEYDVTVDDGNIDLRGQAFTEEWVRPLESDIDRLIALQEYTLNGASSTATNHRDSCEITVDTSHLVDGTVGAIMPIKTYAAGTQPQDVVTDCADTAGRIYSVVIHHDGGSHLCLLYILETDHTTYLSPISISDNLSDWDPTDPSTPTFEPHWEAGKATIYDGQELLSGLVNIYGTDQTMFDQIAGNVTSYDYWVDSYYDGTSVTFAQAADRMYGMLAYRSLTTVSHRVSIIMLPEQLDLVAAGMSVSIKAAAAIGGADLDTWQTRRVAECSFEPRIDGRYWAHLNLDRAQRRSRFSHGAGQPAATTPQDLGELPPGGVISNTGGCALISTFGGTWAVQDPGVCDFDMATAASGSTVTFGPTAGSGDDFCNSASFSMATLLPMLPGTTGRLKGRIVVPEIDPNYPPTSKDVYMRLTVGGPSDSTQILLNVRHEYGFIGDGGSGNLPDDDIYLFDWEIGSTQNRIKIWSSSGPKPDAWTIDPVPTQSGGINAIAIGLDYFNINIPEGGDLQEEVFIVGPLTWCASDGGPAAYYNIWTTPMQSAVADGTDVTFSLPTSPAGNVLDVTAYINGVYEPIVSFDAGARTFTFANAPEAGDVIDVAWIPIQ